MTEEKRLVVHFRGSAKPELLASLRPLLNERVILTSGDDISDPEHTEILITGLPEKKSLDGCANLRALIIPWAGLPKATAELMRGYPQIAIHNIHHNATPTAEHAVGLMLAAAKRIAFCDRHLRRGDWSPRYLRERGALLAGKTALVLGFGAIGRRVARACCGLGLEVRAIRRSPGGNDHDGVVLHGPGDLEMLLPQANVLFVTLPLTAETEGLIGARQLRLLPDGAVLVNVARGAIVDEQALYNELATGRIAAGLDVWYRYPKTEPEREALPPSSLPFAELDNVVMTPHLGGSSHKTEQLRAEALAGLLNAAAEGRPMPNRVDLEEGY